MPSQAKQISSVLDDVADFIDKYVVVTPQQRDALAIFVVHTHLFGAASFTPYMLLTSPDMASGKSLMLDVLEKLVARPFRAEDVTVAVLVNQIHTNNATILLDEGDNTLNRLGTSMRAVLNSGFRKGGGKRATMRGSYNTFGPKVIAMIGKPTGTIASRCVVIEMKRKLPSEIVSAFEWDEVTLVATPLRERIEALVTEQLIEGLRHRRPTRPERLDDRQFDVWKPLLAIADASGSKWANRARKAATKLYEARRSAVVSETTRLLIAMKGIYQEVGGDRIKTSDLIYHLSQDETGPWSDWWSTSQDGPAGGAARRLRTMISPYEIESSTHRFPDGTVAKGYLWAQFKDAFERYARMPDDA